MKSRKAATVAVIYYKAQIPRISPDRLNPVAEDALASNTFISTFTIYLVQADLKWIEDNIPTSLTDHLLMDEEEDRDARELEMNKML